jgi:hypothetical protein
MTSEAAITVKQWQHKARIGVRLTTTTDSDLNGFVFCAEGEGLSAVLNDGRPFLLLQPRPGCTELINKSRIRGVRLLDHVSRELDNYQYLGDYGAVKISFDNGSEKQGRVCPRVDERVSDILNRPNDFFLFVSDEDQMTYVNTDFVEQIIMNQNDR